MVQNWKCTGHREPVGSPPICQISFLLLQHDPLFLVQEEGCGREVEALAVGQARRLRKEEI